MRIPPSLVRLASLFVLWTAGCGSAGRGNPCGIVASGIGLSSAPLADMPAATSLSCTGSAGGAPVDCTQAPEVERHSCGDGFGFVLRSGDSVLELRLLAAGSWSAGANLNGETLDGSLTIAGLPPPSAPLPESGTEQALSGAFNSRGAVVDASLRTRW